MSVILFSPRFAPLVEAHTKCQTIRKERKRPIKVGDLLSLREWTGKPYCSKQRILRDPTPCISVNPVEITDTGIYEYNNWNRFQFPVLSVRENERAREDGFSNFSDMLDWFHATHGLPFRGVLIRWAA